MTPRRAPLAAVAALFALCFSAAAAPRAWEIDTAASVLEIVYLVNGEERRGRVERFTGAATFDPDDPAAASLELVFDMDSVDVGDRFGTAVIKSGDWFYVEAHPTARYVLERLEPIGDGRHRAFGRLTLRGETREVAGDLTLDIGAERAEAAGGATFERSRFGLGVGLSALFVEVGDLVSVEFMLTAAPAR